MNQGYVFQLLYNFYGYQILQNWNQPFLDFGLLFRDKARHDRKGTLSFHRNHRGRGAIGGGRSRGRGGEEGGRRRGLRIMIKTGSCMTS